jgi:hypothetical protein
MPALQASDIADITVAVLKNLGRLKMTDLMSSYQNTVFLKRMVPKGKMTFQGGDECQFNIITDTNHSARGVGLYYTANVNPNNVLTTGKMPWRHNTFNWAIERREIAMNSGSANKILELIKTRRIAALGDQILYYENRGWRLPAATNNVDFMGIPYWIVKSATDAQSDTSKFGFNGGAPSGYTLVANIDPTLANITPKWNNYADAYTNVTKADLIRKMEVASDMTDFMPLVDDIPQYNTGDDYGYYTTRAVRQSCKEILESQNENLGFDLDPAQGKLVYRRAPLVWVKELDSDTSSPIYGINWGTFKMMALSGEWQKETVIPVHSNQPTVQATHVDSSVNTYCVDRRRNFVISTSTSSLS